MQERLVTVNDGLDIFVRDLPATAPEVGLPVLCLHGLTRNSKDFETILPRIAAGGRRALALDVRGRGRSSRDPEPTRYAVPTYVGDVLAVLDALALPQVAAIGTSMGGLIAMAIAAIAPARLERLALNDVGPELAPEGLARIAGYVGRAEPAPSWEAAADRAWSINALAFPDAPPSFWLAMARRTFREEAPGRIVPDYDPAIAIPFAQAPAAPVDLWPLFEAAAQRPLLVVRGALSDLLSPAGLARMQARAPGMLSVEAARVGHAPMLDEPDVWPAIAAFLGLRAG